MSASLDSQRPPEEDVALAALPGGFPVSTTTGATEASAVSEDGFVLSALPIGAHLILRCRKDWRDATVVAVTLEAVTLSVGTPKGRTYRVRRPPHTPLSFEGAIPVCGEGSWRAGFARYDARW